MLQPGACRHLPLVLSEQLLFLYLPGRSLSLEQSSHALVEAVTDVIRLGNCRYSAWTQADSAIYP